MTNARGGKFFIKEEYSCHAYFTVFHSVNSRVVFTFV